MNKQEIFQDCQRQIERLDKYLIDEIKQLGVNVDDVSKNFLIMDTFQYDGREYKNIDEHILKVAPIDKLPVACRLFLFKLYETALFRLLANLPTPKI